MHRNRWFLLLNEKPPIGKNLDKGVKIFCNAIKQATVIAVNKNRFDYAACKKNLDEKLQKLLVMLKNEPRLRRIFETLSRVRAEPELLMNPAAEVLDPRDHQRNLERTLGNFGSECSPQTPVQFFERHSEQRDTEVFRRRQTRRVSADAPQQCFRALD